MKPQKKYLFVVRAYNDIDHFTPLIDYLLRNNLAQVYFFSSVHLRYLFPNENLVYLEKTYGLKPMYLLENTGMAWLKWLENINIQISLFMGGFVLPLKIQILTNKILGISYRFFQKKYKQQKYTWADEIWNMTEPDLLIYDWVSPDKFPYLPMTLLAKRNKIPVVSIPHGVNVFLDTDITYKSQDHVKKAEKNRKEQGLNFDWEVAHSESNADHMIKRGVEKDRLVVLGSARFEDLWMKNQNAVFNHQKFKHQAKNNALKIVIFPNKLLYKGKIPEIRDLVIASCKVSKCVVIKPHTRGMKLDFLRDLIIKYDIKVIKNNTPSSLLVDWCDVGVVWGSSIGIQLVGKNKPLISPQFVHDNATFFSKYLPKSQALDLENYSQLLNQIKIDKASNYSDEERLGLLEEQVYDGDVTSCVAKKYVDFFNKISD
jgi:hypothetical protein